MFEKLGVAVSIIEIATTNARQLQQAPGDNVTSAASILAIKVCQFQKHRVEQARCCVVSQYSSYIFAADTVTMKVRQFPGYRNENSTCFSLIRIGCDVSTYCTHRIGADPCLQLYKLSIYCLIKINTICCLQLLNFHHIVHIEVTKNQVTTLRLSPCRTYRDFKRLPTATQKITRLNA